MAPGKARASGALCGARPAGRGAEGLQAPGRHCTKRLAGLLLLIVLLAFAFQGTRGVYAPDEGFYAVIAREMARSGSYLVPRVHHYPWLDKPPLSLWGMALGIELLGGNEWGVRAFHGLSFVLTAWVVYLLGAALFGRGEGWRAALIYSTMLLPFAAANVITPDTPLTLWTTLTGYCFWRSLRAPGRRGRLWMLGGYASCGLGFLTKGPAALVPVGGLFLFLLVRRRLAAYVLTPWSIVGILLFGVLGLSWYAYISWALPGALGYFLDNQVWGRTISPKYARNPGLLGATIYIPVLLGGTLPWSVVWWRLLCRRFRFHPGRIRAAWQQLRGDEPRLFLVLWFAAPLLVLCLASSKLPLYALPLFPALALLAADNGRLRRFLPFARTLPDSLGGIPPLVGLWVVILLALKLCAGVTPHDKNMRTLYKKLEPYLADGKEEIVAVNAHLEGIAFYASDPVERVSTSEKPYPFYVLPKSLEEEISEISRSTYRHLIITGAGKNAARVERLLTRYRIDAKELSLSARRKLFIVPPGGVAEASARQMAAGTTADPASP